MALDVHIVGNTEDPTKKDENQCGDSEIGRNIIFDMVAVDCKEPKS